MSSRWCSAVLFALGGCATTQVGGVPLAEHPEPDLVTVRHRVEPGQTLYRIAKAYDLTVEDLAAANGIIDPRSLSVGQELVIPGAAQKESVLVPDDGEPQGASSAHPPAGDQRPLPPARPPPVGNPKGTLFWPVRGVLYARFGRKGAAAVGSSTSLHMLSMMTADFLLMAVSRSTSPRSRRGTMIAKVGSWTSVTKVVAPSK